MIDGVGYYFVCEGKEDVGIGNGKDRIKILFWYILDVEDIGLFDFD